MEIILKTPNSEEEFLKYYDLRWRILREPWKQPKGSEKDNLEKESIHITALDENEIVGVGRIHFNNEKEAQVRYMAVEKDHQGKGVGKKILEMLEKKAKEKGARYIVLNSRDSAIPFYKKSGYEIVNRIDDFLDIPHYKMKKDIK